MPLACCMPKNAGTWGFVAFPGKTKGEGTGGGWAQGKAVPAMIHLLGGVREEQGEALPDPQT